MLIRKVSVFLHATFHTQTVGHNLKKMNKDIFFVTPIGPKTSPQRKRSDHILKYVLRPICKELDYKIKRGDKEFKQHIPDNITDLIFESSIVIADLSDLNANVFYELGKRHAWKGKTIHITQDVSSIPFDISHLRAIEYDLNDIESVENLKKQIRKSILHLQDEPIQPFYSINPDDIIELTNSTILKNLKISRRDHYYLAEDLLNDEISKIFLMQRSSTLILGAESGWGAEKSFYKALTSQISKAVELYHIANLDGIKSHLTRESSVFPETENAISHFTDIKNKVGIVISPSKTMFIKKLPVVTEESDFKSDRQARILLVENKDGTVEGVLVWDLGVEQSSFHLKGPDMKEYLDKCINYYHKCDILTWNELRNTVND